MELAIVKETRNASGARGSGAAEWLRGASVSLAGDTFIHIIRYNTDISWQSIYLHKLYGL